VIVPTSELGSVPRGVAMVDGGFDPLHAGHIAYFRAARALGWPVLCNVSGDHYVRSKHEPLLPEEQRVTVLAALRDIDYVHLSNDTTANVLRRLRPVAYVKGEDWRGRLPAEQVRLCAELGIEIVFLDTVVDSSSRLLREYVRSNGGAHA
jgi:cytidyltransferase-like protein